MKPSLTAHAGVPRRYDINRKRAQARKDRATAQQFAAEVQRILNAPLTHRWPDGWIVS